MLWSAFQTAVDEHLMTEANRRGTATFKARQVRNGVLDLQRYIRGYRSALKTTYLSTSPGVVVESQAQVVTLPAGAILKAAYIYSLISGDDPNCQRERLEFYPWNNRQDLICGRLDFLTWWGQCYPGCACGVTLTADQQALLEAKAYVYTMSPMARTMLIYPQITASTRLEIDFDGFLYSPAPGDTVPFPEQASEAVAMYYLWHVASSIDKDLALARERQAEYYRLRLSLYRDFVDLQMLNGDLDESENATVVPP